MLCQRRDHKPVQSITATLRLATWCINKSPNPQRIQACRSSVRQLRRVTAIVFNPANFSATASNGGLQFTDGTLNTLIVANPSQFITTIDVNEYGDYTLAGTGNSSTYASISAPVY